jgi:hypothetical protein
MVDPGGGRFLIVVLFRGEIIVVVSAGGAFYVRAVGGNELKNRD